jgi:two-component system OmpR family response regulator
LTRRDVVVLRWPDDAEEVDRLAAARLPRLLLVEETADAPESGDCEEDWIRLPADDRDVGARLRALARRAGRHQALPELDEHGRVHHRGRWVAPSPIEQRIMSILVQRFGVVVSADELVQHGWPGGRSKGGSLRVHMTRLRKQIEPLGLDIRSVRQFGYVLEELGAGEAT